jgi:hypothetical protein
MDFWKAILGLARRKLLIIPLLGSTIALGLAGYFLTPPHYVSNTTMVLVTPALGGTLSQDPTKPIDLTNPMLNSGNNLKTASSILIQAINTPEAAAEVGVVKRGPTQLTVDDGRTNPQLLDSNGPFIYIAGDSTSKAEARDVVLRAQARLRKELVDRQKALGAPPETYLTMVDVVAPTTPKVSRAQRIKIGSIAFVLSLVFGLSMAYAWQRVRANRQRLKQGELSPAPQSIELDSSRYQARRRHLELAGDALSADEGAGDTDSAGTNSAGTNSGDTNSGDTNSIAAALLVDEGPGGVEVPVAPDERDALDELSADGEPQVADDEQAAEVERLAEPEYISEARQTEDGWDLYIVDYPPTEQIAQRGGSDSDELDWTLDWSLEGLESERRSAVVGPRHGV